MIKSIKKAVQHLHSFDMFIRYLNGAGPFKNNHVFKPLRLSGIFKGFKNLIDLIPGGYQAFNINQAVLYKFKRFSKLADIRTG